MRRLRCKVAEGLRVRIFQDECAANPRDKSWNEPFGALVSFSPDFSADGTAYAGDVCTFLEDVVTSACPAVWKALDGIERLLQSAGAEEETIDAAKAAYVGAQAEGVLVLVWLSARRFRCTGWQIRETEQDNADACMYVTLAEARECFGNVEDLVKRTRESIFYAVEEYEQWLNGEVYGYTVSEVARDEDGEPLDDEEAEEEVDSCWGFYGTNWKENGLAEYVAQHSEALAKVLQ